MRRLLGILLIFIITLGLDARAQDPASILDTFTDKTNIKNVEGLSDGKSSLCKMSYSAGLQSSDVTVVAHYPDKYRVTMRVDKEEVLIVITDGVAYVVKGGEVEVIKDRSMIAQIMPLVDFAGDMAPRKEDFRDLKLVGRSGRGKNECYVVEGVKIVGAQKMTLLFNIATGLLSEIQTTYINEKGAVDDLTIKAKDYTNFADGELYLPSKFVAKTPDGNINIAVGSFQLNYTTSPEIFKAPKL